MKPGPDGMWAAHVDDAELLIAGDGAGPFAAQRDEAARVARRLPSVVAALWAFLPKTTACAEADWPQGLPLDFRSFVAVPGAEARWSLQWLEFRPGAPGSFRAFFMFEDAAAELLYVLWIVEVQDDVPRSSSWQSW